MAAYTKDFTRFWEAYPPLRKKAKRATQAKWKVVVKEIMDDRNCTLLEAIGWLQGRASLFADSDEGQGEYCPGPEVWLNKGRYDDDPEVWGKRRVAYVETDRVKAQEWRP